MPSATALLAKGADSRDIGGPPLLLGGISLGGELDEGMQRHLHPRALLLGDIHVVGVDAAEDGLVGDDDDVLAALELHDDGLEADDDVAVALAAAVAIVVLVVVARFEVLGIEGLDLGVGQAVADARVELVQRFPFELARGDRGGGEVPGRLDGALQGRGPDRQRLRVGLGFLDERGQGEGVEGAAGGEGGVATDFALEVVGGFAVLCMSDCR